jgi:hypothetical protein
MRTDDFETDLRDALDRAAASVPVEVTDRILTRRYRTGHRRRIVGGVVGVAAAVVIGIAAVAVISSPKVHNQAPAWRLVSYVGSPSWHKVGQTNLAEAFLTCPTTSTCYEEGWAPAATQTTQILITHNGGATWTHWLGPPGYLWTGPQSLSCANADWCVTLLQDQSGPYLFFVTANGGKTWTSLPGPTNLPWNFAVTGVSCPAAGSCLALGSTGTGPGTLNRSLTTTNGWRTWTESKLPAGFSSGGVQCFVGGHCVTLGGNVVAGVGTAAALYSTNGGATWRAADLPDNMALYSFSCSTAVDCMAVGSATTTGRASVVVTTDGGRSWTPVSGKLPHATPAVVACATPYYCWSSVVSPLDLAELHGSASVPYANVLFVTRNGADHWQPVSLPAHLADASFQGYGMSCPSMSRCFALGYRTQSQTPGSRQESQALVLLATN